MGEKITVAEGSQPQLIFHLRELQPDGSKTPLYLNDIDGVVFRIKEGLEDDATVINCATTVTADGTLQGAEYSVVTAQIPAAATTDPINKYYQLIVTKNTFPDVIKHGFFEVENV